MRSTDCWVVGSQVGICSYAIGLHPLCYFFCFLCSFFHGCICWKEAVILVVMLIFCDYACTYAPFLWLIMLKRGNCYARGWLCSFLLLVCLPFFIFAGFFSDGSVSAPCIRCFAREHYDAVSEHPCFACTFLFYNVARHHKLFPEKLPGDRSSLRRVL